MCGVLILNGWGSKQVFLLHASRSLHLLHVIFDTLAAAWHYARMSKATAQSFRKATLGSAPITRQMAL